jgi:hypothetical protein
VRWRSIVGVAASTLAVAMLGIGSAAAQTPVTEEQTKAEKQPAAEPPKPVEEPKADKPAKPVEEPKADKPAKPVEEPKAEKPKAAKPAEEPKPAKPAEEPKPAKPAEEPKADKPEPAQPKPAKPKPAQPEPVHAEAGAPTAQAPAPAAAPRQRAATTTSHKSRVRHVTDKPAGKQRQRAASHPRGAAGVERSDPPATRRAVDAVPTPRTRPTHSPKQESPRATVVAASVDRRQPRALPLDSSRTGYDLAQLLAIVATASIAYLLGRHVRRDLRGT